MNSPSLEWSPPEAFEEYRLVRLLGRGAMGQVYLAHDTLLDRPVAVKFVHAADNDGARERFFLEARAIARLAHPNVVAIYRVAEVLRHPFLVSEYVRGRALNQLDRPVAWPQVLDIALDLARGLAAAHRSGVLHRDIKPANAILSEDGDAKLLDFGLAKLADVAEHGADPDFATSGAEPSPSRAISVGGASVTSSASPRSADATVSIPGRVIAAPASSPASAVAAAVVADWIGTPLYMAPELWRGEAASVRTDLYALGILLYELLSGAAPHRGVPVAELGDVVQATDNIRLHRAAPEVEPTFAAVVDRLVEREPSARFASAQALIVALEECANPLAASELPDGNPYRGLFAFDAGHRMLFFGRRSEIRELADRVMTEALVIVGGDSGVGKSSLCRAGVLPWLVENHGWSCIEVVPGQRAVRSLAAALATWTGGDEAALARRLYDSPDEVAREIRQHNAQPVEPGGNPRRLLLFIDQLEELLTLATPEDSRVFAATLAALSVRTPSIRVLATARADFLSRLAALPALGNEMARALYFLRPLLGDGIREAIVRPAAAKGVEFSSEQLVDTLVEQAEHAPGGLPLLQFTLAELWDVRDATERKIRAEALVAMGGVEGALTRHADRLMASLPASERDAARRFLLRLVTVEGTRARRLEAELLTNNDDRGAERAALEALVRGRLVVAKEDQNTAMYEIAHEALLTNWLTLQDWLQQGAADRIARGRVERAAIEWERLGKKRDVLWSSRQLAEAKGLDRNSLAAREAAFLTASRRAIWRGRWLGAFIALIVIGGVTPIGLTLRRRAVQQLNTLVDGHRQAAAHAQQAAKIAAVVRDTSRDIAGDLFDAHHWDDGEKMWKVVEGLVDQVDEHYVTAASELESALSLAPARDDIRQRFADITFERLQQAKLDRQPELEQDLEGILVVYDDGHRRAQLTQNGFMRLDVGPAGTAVWLERAGAVKQLLGRSPLPPLSLAPGSMTLELQAPGRVTTSLPLLLQANQYVELSVTLPDAATAPPDMVYVPPGDFLFGSGEGDDLRTGFLNTAPLHRIHTNGYFIGRHEVTFAQWIEFLDNLPAAERTLRTPGASSPQNSIALTATGPKQWRLTLKPTSTATYVADVGQRIAYQKRALHSNQDWLKFPVAAISPDDAAAYVNWLDRTGRIVGARLCDEFEWERAARGADARRFPSGESLATDDANIDVTYGREPLAFGPDEVGLHPGSRSPVGAEDMAGNVWEWTSSVETLGAPVARGGSWYNNDLTSRATNREYGEPTQRHPLIGLRVCASSR